MRVDVKGAKVHFQSLGLSDHKRGIDIDELLLRSSRLKWKPHLQYIWSSYSLAQSQHRWCLELPNLLQQLPCLLRFEAQKGKVDLTDPDANDSGSLVAQHSPSPTKEGKSSFASGNEATLAAAARAFRQASSIGQGAGVMGPAFSSLSGYFVAILLLQITVLTSEQFTVSSSRNHHVVMVGSQAELSCWLSPPQNAQLMQVGWFRDRHSQMIYLYEDGEEHSGEGIQNYMNRTVFLKDALEEGKITLQIYNVTVFDGGQYHCFFKDGHTYEEGIVDLRVAAVGLDVQINVQVLNTEGFVVECTSGGWFPQAQMAWKDSSGNVIPHSSKSYSQDGAGLLHLKMTILLKNNTHGPVTCCFYNPVTGQEKRAGIVIPASSSRISERIKAVELSEKCIEEIMM
ncbi:hypothetical protein H8959_001260 [Pygathrix nigripes]